MFSINFDPPDTPWLIFNFQYMHSFCLKLYLPSLQLKPIISVVVLFLMGILNTVFWLVPVVGYKTE